MRPPEIIGLAGADEWDRFVGSHPMGQVYHLTAWKNVLERCFKHIKGYGFAIHDKEGRILAGLPVFRVRSWLTGTRLVGAPFATLYDPLVSEPDQMEALSGTILETSCRLGCSHIEIRAHQGDRYFAGTPFTVSRFYKLHYLDLDVPLEALERRFHRTCVRQRISRAQKSGLHLKTADRKADLGSFYSLISLTRAKRGLPPQPWAFFEALWDELRPLGLLSLLLAEKEGRPIAAVLLLTYRDRVTVEFAASDESFLCYSPIHFLFWEAIKLACAGRYRIIDFGQTSPNNQSLMEFKSRWGAKCIDLPHYFFPAEAAAADSRREETWKYIALRKLLALPMPSLARRSIGIFCYRHLG